MAASSLRELKEIKILKDKFGSPLFFCHHRDPVSVSPQYYHATLTVTERSISSRIVCLQLTVVWHTILAVARDSGTATVATADQ